MKKKCKTCYGYELWAVGSAFPVGPIYAGDGVPTLPCHECKANANPVKLTNETTKDNDCMVTRKSTNVHNCVQLKTYGKTVYADFPDDTSLDDVLYTLGGLIKALGYCFDGNLEIVETDN